MKLQKPIVSLLYLTEIGDDILKKNPLLYCINIKYPAERLPWSTREPVWT